MTTLTREEIERGLAENRHAPGGAARNAHAEVLAGAAEASGDAALFREALDNLINAYLYSAESPKLLVPFARLLQEYDKDPGAFSEGATHSLFWQFKWVATAIGNSPDIPLESASQAGWRTWSAATGSPVTANAPYARPRCGSPTRPVTTSGPNAPSAPGAAPIATR